MSGCEATEDVKKIIRAMAKNRVESGVHDPADLVDAIHDEIKDHTPLWKSEISDIISGYGHEPRKATKSELQARMDAIKSQLRAEARAVDRPAKLDAQRQTQLKKQMADIQRQIDTGDFSTKKPQRPDYTEQTRLLERQRDKLQRQADRAEMELSYKNKSGAARLADTVLAFRRAVILSSYHTLGKLTAAATMRNITTPIEEAIGTALGYLPGIKGLMEKAPREGKISIGAEAEALKKAYSKKTLQEMWDTATTGTNDLDAKFDNIHTSPHPWLDVPGRAHGALKHVAKRDEYYRSLWKRTDFEVKRMAADGKTPAQIDEALRNPLTKDMLEAKAYADAKRSIFMDDNALVSMFHSMNRHLDSMGPAGKVASYASKYVFPIVKIPTNYVHESLQYATGIQQAGAKVLYKLIKDKVAEHAAKRDGEGKFKKDSMTDDDRDLLARLLKKGAFGLALILIGYLNPDNVGGYYQPGDRRKPTDPEVGGIRLWGHNIPRYLVHNPALEMLQIGATIRRVADKTHKDKATGKPVRAGEAEGAWQAGKGIVGEIPFIDAPGRIATGLKDTKSAGAYVGSQLRDAVIPPDVQGLAKAMDPSALKRRPSTFTEAIESGIPGLRTNVPTQDIKHMTLDQKLDAYEKMNPAERTKTGMGEAIYKQAHNQRSALTPDQIQRIEAIQ